MYLVKIIYANSSVKLLDAEDREQAVSIANSEKDSKLIIQAIYIEDNETDEVEEYYSL